MNPLLRHVGTFVIGKCLLNFIESLFADIGRGREGRIELDLFLDRFCDLSRDDFVVARRRVFLSVIYR